MKKLFYVGALSALLLAACGEEKEAAPKEETPASEQSGAKEKTVDAETKKSPVEDVIKSVTKDDFEISQNNGIVSIIIKDEKAHEGSKSLMLKDSAEIFAGLSKINKVTAATIKWHAPLTDQYGNKKMDEVLAIMIDGETFKKVNWDNYKSLDIEAIASGFKQNPALKN